jgi:hypothetical protein
LSISCKHEICVIYHVAISPENKNLLFTNYGGLPLPILAPYPIEDFTDYISAFYIMVIETLNRNNLTEDDWNRTVSVSSVCITPKIKKLTTEQKEMLFRSGKESTKNYFRR